MCCAPSPTFGQNVRHIRIYTISHNQSDSSHAQCTTQGFRIHVNVISEMSPSFRFVHYYYYFSFDVSQTVGRTQCECRTGKLWTFFEFVRLYIEMLQHTEIYGRDSWAKKPLKIGQWMDWQAVRTCGANGRTAWVRMDGERMLAKMLHDEQIIAHEMQLITMFHSGKWVPLVLR